MYKKHITFNIIIILLRKLLQAAKLMVYIPDMSRLYLSREADYSYRGTEF